MDFYMQKILLMKASSVIKQFVEWEYLPIEQIVFIKDIFKAEN